MTEWRPIETAPKDATEIILWNGDDVTAGVWQPLFGAGWCYGNGIPMKPQPIKWMPLPPPPPIESKPLNPYGIAADDGAGLSEI